MPFTNAIDTFARGTEIPLSDSGNWYQPHPLGNTAILGINVDGAHANIVGISPGDGSGGAAFAIRTANPGPNYDEDIAITLTGTFVNTTHPDTISDFGVIWALARCDLAGNGYLAKFGAAAPSGTLFTIYTASGWTLTKIAQTTLSSVNFANIGCGIRAIGTTISAWYNTGSGWVEALSVTDSTFTSGLLGFGVYADAAQLTAANGGQVTGENPLSLGVFTPPILIPYSKPSVPA